MIKYYCDDCNKEIKDSICKFYLDNRRMLHVNLVTDDRYTTVCRTCLLNYIANNFNKKGD